MLKVLAPLYISLNGPTKWAQGPAQNEARYERNSSLILHLGNLIVSFLLMRMRKDEEEMMKWILHLNLIFYSIWTLKPKLVWTLNNPHF